MSASSRNILIVGATGGIGSGIAQYLTQQGNRCIMTGRNEEKLKNIAAELGDALYFVCDIEHAGQITAMFDALRQKDIKLDGMVHCAGVSPLMSVADNDDAVMRQTFQVNFFSFISLMQQFQKVDISNDGASVVAMSSVATEASAPRQTVYAASKSALDTAVHAMAKEFLPRKLRINTIVSGAIDTEMLHKLEAQSPYLHEKLTARYPLGTIPIEQIACAVEFLLSPKAAYITGTNMVVDSGFLIQR